MKQTNDWQKPKTTRRYLQPPKSERLFTLWAEGKLVFGDEIDNREGWSYYKTLESCGVWLVYGDNREQFDFRTVQNVTTPDGTPVHRIIHRIGVIEISEEGFCNTVRNSTCFVRITVKNRGEDCQQLKLGLVLRTAKEIELVYGGSDGYVSYAPDVDVWKALPSTWMMQNGRYSDNNRYLTINSPETAEWNEKTGTISYSLRLEPGTEAEIFFSLDKGEVDSFDYDYEKEQNQAFWKTELARINKLPEKLAYDQEKMKMVRHLVVQLLQCFAYPVGKSYLLARQGGLQRIIWPTEALSVFEALGRIGDFSDYIEPALSAYFNELQEKDGEIKNFGIYWASITGAALYSFAKYSAIAGKCFYDRFRNQAFAAFQWIKKTRHSVADADDLAGGLFPPMRGTDWEQQFQCWTVTDVFNLYALDAFAATTALLNDPDSELVRTEHRAYLADMQRHFRPFLLAAGDSDELRIPLKPAGSDQKLLDAFYPCLYHGRFIFSGVIDLERDIRRVYRYMQRTGVTERGLYGHMPYANGNRHIWYVSFPDYYWFKIWKSLNENEKAAEILEAQLNYAMTDEYYLIERYADNDPYYVPWSPNASATGRTLLMLIES